MAAQVALQGNTLVVGEIRTLFGPVNVPYYDVSADGQRFLIPVHPNEKSGEPLTLIENWAAALKK